MNDLSSYSDQDLEAIAGGQGQTSAPPPPDLSGYSDSELEALAAPIAAPVAARPLAPNLATPRTPQNTPQYPAREPQIGPSRPSTLEQLGNAASAMLGGSKVTLGTPGDRTLLGRLLYGEEATPRAPDYGAGYNLPLVKSKELIAEPGLGDTSLTAGAQNIGRGVLGAVDEMTTPGGLSMLSGVAGAEAIGSKVLTRLVSAGFSYQMAKALYQEYPEFKRAADAGDYQGAAELAGKMIASGGMLGLAGTQTLKPTPKPLGEPPERIVARQVVSGQMSAKDAVPTAQFLKSIETPQPPEIPVQEKTWLPADVVNRKALPAAKPADLSVEDWLTEHPPAEIPRPAPEIVKPTETSQVVARNLEPLPETIPRETTTETQPTVQEHPELGDRLVREWDDGRQRFKRPDGSYYEVLTKKAGRPAQFPELEGLTTTLQANSSPITGKFLPDRTLLHEEILNRHLEGKPPAEGQPTIYVLGGGTASGKTTMSRAIIGDDPNTIRIDPDEMKLEVPEYDRLKAAQPDKASKLVHDESSYLSKELLEEAIARRLNITYDTTTSGSGKPGFIRHLKDKGYRVVMMFADVPVEEAIRRADLRARESTDPINKGRFVPHDLIRQIHGEAARNFFELKDLTDETHLYDNSGKEPELVYKRVANGPENTYNNSRYEAFKQKGSGKSGQIGIRPGPDTDRSGRPVVYQGGKGEGGEARQGEEGGRPEGVSTAEAAAKEVEFRPVSGAGQVVSVPVDRIKVSPEKFQPREGLNQTHLQAIAEDMKKNGYDEKFPVELWRNPDTGGVELLAGHHRLEGAKRAGLKDIPAKIYENMTIEEAKDYARRSNSQAAPLHPMEEARAFELERKKGKNLEQISKLYGGKKTTEIQDRLALNNLSPGMQGLVRQDVFSIPHAIVLGKAVEKYKLSPEIQEQIYHKIVKELDVTPTELKTMVDTLAPAAQQQMKMGLGFQIERGILEPLEEVLRKTRLLNTQRRRLGGFTKAVDQMKKSGEEVHFSMIQSQQHARKIISRIEREIDQIQKSIGRAKTPSAKEALKVEEPEAELRTPAELALKKRYGTGEGQRGFFGETDISKVPTEELEAIVEEPKQWVVSGVDKYGHRNVEETFRTKKEAQAWQLDNMTRSTLNKRETVTPTERVKETPGVGVRRRVRGGLDTVDYSFPPGVTSRPLKTIDLKELPDRFTDFHLDEADKRDILKQAFGELKASPGQEIVYRVGSGSEKLEGRNAGNLESVVDFLEDASENLKATGNKVTAFEVKMPEREVPYENLGGAFRKEQASEPTTIAEFSRQAAEAQQGMKEEALGELTREGKGKVTRGMADVKGPLFGNEEAKTQAGLFGSEKGAVQIGKPQKIDVSGIDDAKTPKAPLGQRAKEKVESSWDNFIRRHYDQFIHVKRLVEEAYGKAGARELPAAQDPYKIMRTAFGGTAGGKSALAFMDYGSVVKDATKERLDEALTTYLRLKGKDRAISLVEEKLADRKQRMTGLRSEIRNLNQMIKTTEETKGSFGGREATKLEALKQQRSKLARELSEKSAKATQFERELRENKVVPGGDNHQTIARKLAELERRASPGDYAKVEQYGKAIFDLNRKGWDLAHSSGQISDELHDKGIQRGNEYVTMSRVTDDVPQAEGVKGAGMSAKQVIKPLEGSERELEDPISASMNMHQDIIHQAVKNDTVRKFVGWANGPESKGVADVRPLKPNELPSMGNGEISFRDKGKLQRYQVDQKLADTINLADASTGDYVGKTFMSFMNRFVKGAITGYNLAFAIPNVARDLRTQALISKAGLKNPLTHPLDFANLTKEWVKALKQQNENDPDFRAMMESGAGFSTMQSRLSAGEYTGKEKGIPILRNIGNLNQRLETSTKLTTWKRSKAMSMSNEDAAWETKNFGGSPDFSSKGTKSGITGTIFLFLNARVQGAGQTLKGIQRNPARFGYIMAGYTAAELGIQAWNNQFKNPDDGKPEWDHVSDTDKQNYTIIFRPSTEQKANGTTRYRQVRIPKSHLEQTVLNPLQEAIAGMMGNRFDATQTAIDAAANLLPLSGNVRKKSPFKDLALGAVSSLHPVFKEGVEQAANYDTFRKAPIVPRPMQDVEAKYQVGPNTPEVLKRAGEKFGVSPLRLEHGARSFGLGSVFGAGDLFLKDIKGKMPLEGDERLGRTPIVGDIMRRFVGGSADEVLNRKTEGFYDYLEKSRQARVTLNMLKKSDREEAKQRYQDSEFRKLYNLAPKFQEKSKDLSEIRTATRQVQQSERLSDDEKKARVKNLYQRQVKILDWAEGLMNR